MHPNSLANLKTPWQPGERPPPAGPRGLRRIEKALEITQNVTPKAARLIARAISDPDLPMSTRLRCAEYVLDKALPTQKGASMVLESGAEWLELRFVNPSGQATDTASLKDQAISTTYSVEPETSHTSTHTDVNDGSEEDQ